MKDLLERLRAALADRYAIDREIGRGGTARVYAAQDLRHRRVVALKVLRPEISIMLGADRFLREIEIAARLQHPHVVPLFDSGERDGLVYYVMPLLAGETLRERLAREGRLPIAEVVRLSREVADALGYAHRQGVVHRDVKPENVRLAEGHAFVMDFGVARALYSATQHEGITTAGLSVGTPAYMAPEQASAEPEIDGRADLYALGVIMYEMLAGRPPFRADTVQQVVAAQLATAPEPVERHREDVPPPLAALVRRLLAKAPARRPQRAEELLTVLEALAANGGGAPPAPRWRRRVAPAAALLAGAVALALLARPRATPPAARLEIGRARQLTFDATLELDPALSPDGEMLAFAQGTPSTARVFVRRRDGDRPVALLPDLPAPQRWPRWSPDGTRLAVETPGGVVIVPALGG
ncbi:MAG TPA: protein kinase, partial [Gemmatimonadales bacterium]|nr:protein kinase [Gemmatimonadales bacterium]